MKLPTFPYIGAAERHAIAILALLYSRGVDPERVWDIPWESEGLLILAREVAGVE
jgi:hypothetical protein